MKKLIYIIMCTAVLFMSQSCSKESPFSGEEATMGQVITSNLILEFINEDLQSRAGTDVNLADFTVAFCKNSDETPYVEYKYNEMPEVVSLPAGMYRVKAYYGKEVDADWESPYYYGITDPVTVTAKKITTIEKPIKCKLQNVKVTVEYNEELKQLMSADSKVDVNMVAGAVLTFTKDETRSGFLKAEGTTMIANFTGTVNGQQAQTDKKYSDVKPGTHYHILFVYKAAGVTGDGTIDPTGGIKVNAQVTVTDINDGTNLEGGGDDEYLEDDRNKGGEDEPDVPDTPDVPNPPAAAGPVIDGGEKIDLSDGDASGTLIPVTVTSGMECVIKITSVTGFTQFTADIVSPNLSPEELASVGLSGHLDLCNPGEYADALEGLGLLQGGSYLGAKSADFSLTGFLSMLAMFGPAQHSFVLTVGDESGTTVKTLTLKFE